MSYIKIIKSSLIFYYWLLYTFLIWKDNLFKFCDRCHLHFLPWSRVKSDQDCTKDIKDNVENEAWKKGAWETVKYRNVFLDAGYKKADIDAKLVKAYHDVFEGPNRVYFEVGDSMAYVSDLKNHDARTEDCHMEWWLRFSWIKKDVFDPPVALDQKIYAASGRSKRCVFCMECKTRNWQHNSEGSASDGELYLSLTCWFAANRWGNNTGINYYAKPGEF